MRFIFKLADMISPRTLQIIKNIEDLGTKAESKDIIIVADLNCPTTINFLKQVGIGT